MSDLLIEKDLLIDRIQKESVFGLDSAKTEAMLRSTNVIGAVSMVVSCNLILDAARRIEELENFIKANCYDMPEIKK